ncbi:MAG TPA: hypothetical protein PLZ45_07570 [Ferruginibacter sp.]|nr:hypothetical protein [Ferruginibacter sp.]
MQHKTNYFFLGFLLLFAMAFTAVGGSRAASGQASLYQQTAPAGINPALPAAESSLTLIDRIPDLSLDNIQEVHSGYSHASRRVQGDKDMLRLHSGKMDEAVKASSGDEIKFADSLTHIYLFLFPYHFFW